MSKCKIKSNWTDSWSEKQLREAQMNGSSIKQVIKFKQENENPPKRSILRSECPEVKTICAQRPMLGIHDGILYRKWVPDESPENPMIQFVVPSKIRNEILNQLHNHKTIRSFRCKENVGQTETKILLAWI